MQVDATILVPWMDCATQGGLDILINIMDSVDCAIAPVIIATVSKDAIQKMGGALVCTATPAAIVSSIASPQASVLCCS